MHDFSTFVRDYVANLDLDTCDPHLRRQTALVDLGRVDFLGRYEAFSDDAAHVFQRLGLQFDPEVNPNPSVRRSDHRQHYDADTAALVSSLYERDIRILGYQFDP
jgi:hypothetical protein